jgi:hypothetical protein
MASIHTIIAIVSVISRLSLTSGSESLLVEAVPTPKPALEELGAVATRVL